MFRLPRAPGASSIAKTLCAAAVTVVALSGCEKIKSRLYPDSGPPVDQAWVRDSTFLAREPKILFRAFRRGDDDVLMPIALLTGNNLRTLRMSKRGWNYLDLTLFGTNGKLTSVQGGLTGEDVRIRQRMWENASQPVDSMLNCPNMIPLAKVAMPDGARLAIINSKLPSGMKSLSTGEMEQAVAGIPNLVAPTRGIPAARLSRYTRTLRPILRKSAEPAVLAEYHDDTPDSDTGTVSSRRPRHLIAVMEKGVYGYRPAWVYSTTGKENDRPALRFIDSMDIDGDGKSELFFQVIVPDGSSYTMAFQQRFDAWTEMWRRPPLRCDVS